jgi:hypothetical protein
MHSFREVFRLTSQAQYTGEVPASQILVCDLLCCDWCERCADGKMHSRKTWYPMPNPPSITCSQYTSPLT